MFRKSKSPTPAPTSTEESQSRSTSAKAEKSERPSNASTLSRNLVFEGKLKFSGTVTIDCEFHGSVATDDTLVVGRAGRVTAEIVAGSVEVAGKVRGNIKAKSNVKILSGGEVHGNIETPTIAMEEGVLFEGACTRPSDQKAESLPPPRPQQPPRQRPPAQAQPQPAATAKPAGSNLPPAPTGVSATEATRQPLIKS